jgi:YhcH/YjgK/YiaL family protein
MLVTALENISRQAAVTPRLRKALDFLQNTQPAGLPIGRVEIDGADVYALVQAYETEPAGAEVEMEAHRKYIDVQYIASGEEMMAWAHLAALRNPTPYNPEKDVLHGMLPAGETTPVRVTAGQAAIFYPEDAHAPKLSVSSPCAVKKIVVKVRV